MQGVPEILDIVWVLICAVLVLMMQPGFVCLESGMVRSKNSINVAIKNLADLCVVGLGFSAIEAGKHPLLKENLTVKDVITAFSPIIIAAADRKSIKFSVIVSERLVIPPQNSGPDK